MEESKTLATHLSAALSHLRSIDNRSESLSVLMSDRLLYWKDRVETKVDTFAQYLPSGSGVDNGTKIEIDECNDSRLVLSCGFHHMNDAGYYTQWTQHKIIISATFNGFDIRITGRNVNDIKDYLADLYHYALSQMITLKTTKEMDVVTHCA